METLIKPLEWKDSGPKSSGDRTAHCECGVYAVGKYQDGQWFAVLRYVDAESQTQDELIQVADDRETVMRDCDEDRRDRIRAAIVEDAPAVDIKALFWKAFHGHVDAHHGNTSTAAALSHASSVIGRTIYEKGDSVEDAETACATCGGEGYAFNDLDERMEECPDCDTARKRAEIASPTPDVCPICEKPFKPYDLCAQDVELGQCHVACLHGVPGIDLETGDDHKGPIATYPHEPKGCPIPGALGKEINSLLQSWQGAEAVMPGSALGRRTLQALESVSRALKE